MTSEHVHHFSKQVRCAGERSGVPGKEISAEWLWGGKMCSLRYLFSLQIFYPVDYPFGVMNHNENTKAASDKVQANDVDKGSSG